MTTPLAAVELLSSIQAWLAAGNVEQAAALTGVALTAARTEWAEMEEWVAREEAAAQAWQRHGSSLVRDLNSAEELVEASAW